MRSVRSCFNTGLYLKNLRRCWPLWAGYLLLWILIVPLPLLTEEYLVSANRVADDVLHMATSVGPLLSFAVAIFSAMALFGYLYNASSANMIASLPARREGLFLAALAAGLTWMVGVNLIVSVLFMLVAEIKLGSMMVEIALLLFATLSLQCLCFFGIAVFCAMLTGRLPALPVLYVGFNFIAVLEVIVRSEISTFFYGLQSSMSDFRLRPLSPLIEILSRVRVQETARGAWGISNLWLLAVYALVGLLFAAAALLLYRYRHMERAGDVIALRGLRPVARYVVYFGSALLLGVTFFHILFPNSENVWTLFACALVGGTIGYFGAEMLMRMSFRVLRRSWRGFLLCSLLLTGLAATVDFDLFGVESYTPSLTQVESVTVDFGSEYDEVVLSSPDSIGRVLTLHRHILANREEISSRTYEPEDTLYAAVTLCYDLGGRKVERRYTAAWNEEEQALLRDAIDCPEALMQRVGGEETLDRKSDAEITDRANDRQYSLTEEQLRYLHDECLVPDARDGTIGFSPNFRRDYDTYIYLYVAGESDRDNAVAFTAYMICPTKESYRTNEYLASLGFALK